MRGGDVGIGEVRFGGMLVKLKRGPRTDPSEILERDAGRVSLRLAGCCRLV